jgi:hypothetical protein
MALVIGDVTAEERLAIQHFVGVVARENITSKSAQGATHSIRSEYSVDRYG